MNRRKTKAMLYPFLITLIGSVLLLVMLLLPYASAKDDYKEYLIENAYDLYIEEIEMTNAEAVNISLVEFTKIYAEAANQGIHKEVSIVCIVVIVIFAGFAGITLLLSLCKRPIGIIIFDLLAMGVFRMIHFDFEDRGIIPSDSFDWGIVNYLTYIVGAVILGGAIWLFIEKRKAKKIAETEQNQLAQE